MTTKKQRVRARAVLNDVFKVAEKLDEGASPEALASTVIDYLEQERGEADETLLKMSQLNDITGMSRQAIHARVKKGTFPKPIDLGGEGPGHRVAWKKSEIIAWLRERVDASGTSQHEGRFKKD